MNILNVSFIEVSIGSQINKFLGKAEDVSKLSVTEIGQELTD